jgi:hypothetical protein
MSYIILRGRWFNIIVLNVHAPKEDKTDDVKDSFYEEMERIFDKFPIYHMKILLGDFNAKVGREDVRFEVFTAVTMKNGVFWVVTPCGSCKNRLGISSQRTSVASCSLCCS